MAEWNEREDATYRASVQSKLDAILTQTQLTNGRLRAAEIAIAVLKVGYAVGAIVGAALFVWLLNRGAVGR